MEYLRKRASRFRNNGRIEGLELDKILRELADEEDAITTASLSGSEDSKAEEDSNSLTEEQVEALIMEETECVQKAIEMGLLQVHGTAPNTKGEGIFRLVGENSNGFNNKINGNEKLEKAVELRKELDADGALYVEHRLNLKHKDNKNSFKQMFQREDTVKAIAGHNVHEGIKKGVGRVQEGGTACVAFGESTAYIKSRIKDDTGLGRFCGFRFCGSNGYSTAIISAYNPCKNNRPESGTTYQQHRRYFIMKKNDRTCPLKLFRRDLEALLKKHREAGDKIILFMDHNENIYSDPLGKMLADPEGMAMKEAIYDFTEEKLGATFFRGSRPIDGLWVTQDIDISNACVMPVGYGVGDHRLFVIDIPLICLVGEDPIKVVPASARRLNCRLPYCEENYIEDLEGNIIQHRLIERLKEAHTKSSTFEEVAEKVIKIDTEGEQYMKHAEKICRKLKSCKIPFSPEASIWLRRVQVYNSLLKLHKGKIRNKGNLKRSARRCGIERAFSLSVEEILVKLKHCEAQCAYFKRHGKKYRYRHLERRAQAARDRDEEEVAKKIEAIIKREKERAWWRRLTFVTGKKKSRSVTSVQVDEGNGIVSEKTTQYEVEQAIFKAVHGERYQMAEESPICQGQLREDFGYLANTPSSQQVLDGTYKCAPGTPQAVSDIFSEIARIRKEIPEASTKAIITPEQWKAYWKAQNEETSSSISGLHFGHYKCGAKSDLISHYHAARVSVILAWGIALSRWSNGLTVMLEKLLGCNLVTKLRAILLMEADFNATNKIVYGSRMMDTVRRHNMMPEDVFSEKGRECTDGTLAKTLFYDVTRQARVPAALASVDASNCYDRIAHAIASLVFQAFGVPLSAAESMLATIENMKFFLRTGFGDSTSFSGGSIHIKTQGMCQGNGGGPAAWAVVSLVILSAHKKKGHGAKFVCPITNLSHHLSSVIFVDDTDLLHINMEADETVEEAHQAIQSSVTNWGNLLIVSGGALKPSKCFFSLISFVWKNGMWAYANNHMNGNFGIKVPLPNEPPAEIKHHPVSHSEKTLGAMTSPDGNSKASIALMQEKAQSWVNDIKVGNLTRRMIWFSLNIQFWPRVGYSLCNSMATFAELTASLQSQYYQILPYCGVVRTVTTEARMIDSGFYGIGLPHPGVEALVASSNKLLMHYGCKSSVGLLLKTSLEFLMLEVGFGFQPLKLDYARYGALATHSWIKMLWEKLSMFGIVTEIQDMERDFPRRGDKFLNQVFEDLGFSWSERVRLNRVRVYLQVLFLSDVTTASGARIEVEKMHPRPHDHKWSTYSRWPKEQPTLSDFELWKEAMTSICPSKSTVNKLGEFIAPTHRIWRWKWCSATNELLHISPDTLRMDIYRPGSGANRFEIAVRDVPVEDRGLLCSVKPSSSGFRIASTATSALPAPVPSTFVQVLRSWGCTWLWEKLNISGGFDWVADAISDGSLLAVTDGSYIRELHPHLCSAAFILECTKGRGKIIGHFSEASLAANAYRGELLGLMSIHLLLLSVNKVHPELQGEVDIVSDCLGALRRVSDLPSYRIPTRCKHSDILKNILVNCRDITFSLLYSHVKAHQDDSTDFNCLSKKSQLNCVCDYMAKEDIRTTSMSDHLPKSSPFPLEPICMFVEGEKITSDTTTQISFSAHRQLAKAFFKSQDILSNKQFEEVDWPSVHGTLNSLPKLFQLWASKHVLDVAGTRKFLSYQDKRAPTCPSCKKCVEDSAHIVRCEEVGRTAAFEESVKQFEIWLKENDTCEELTRGLVEYMLGRGNTTFQECIRNGSDRMLAVAVSQDVIGWGRFTEGMVSKHLIELQKDYYGITGSRRSVEKWIRGVITQLLQITHTQWIYRNVVVHDKTVGTLVSDYKCELQKEIDRQLELGVDGLLKEDQFLLEINLGDLESSNGERQEYWLLAIQAARRASFLASEAAARQQAESVRDGHIH